jgi:hypothetical protein
MLAGVFTFETVEKVPLAVLFKPDERDTKSGGVKIVPTPAGRRYANL